MSLNWIRTGAAAASLAVLMAAGGLAGEATAAPKQATVTLKPGVAADYAQYRSRRAYRRGGGAAIAGIAAAIIGGAAIAATRPRYRGYGYDDGYYGGGYAPVYGYGGGYAPVYGYRGGYAPVYSGGYYPVARRRSYAAPYRGYSAPRGYYRGGYRNRGYVGRGYGGRGGSGFVIREGRSAGGERYFGGRVFNGRGGSVPFGYSSPPLGSFSGAR